ncbi:PREDICTED: uncharacterized protein At4g14450, chloroplastic-like [Ipomoea nil]|uniref:uncharacterized protein At4g14450, chloroplastic-like n=1 Tax=Ipomoea nil TaxID=35883 RepID=UPI0009015BC9|nr:PREDICTED: uncharacterized protein At4g14450, chloroplastic-like [Ipomoea nil]
MAESNKYFLPERRQPSRLQRRAPSSIQINRAAAAAHWNVAIPLLSPLVSSPESSNNLTAAINLYSNSSSNKKDEIARKEPEKAPAAATAVLKRWQHPAMPFCQEQAPPFVPFVQHTLIDYQKF